MEEESLNGVCRACSSTDSQLLINVHCTMDNLAEDISYLECFHKCTLLDNSPYLPDTICLDCSLELEAAYLFINKCKETDLALRVGQQTLKESTSHFECIEVDIKPEPEPMPELDLATHLERDELKENNSQHEFIGVEQSDPLPQEKLEPSKTKKRKFASRISEDTSQKRGNDTSAKMETSVKSSNRRKTDPPPVEEEEMTTCKICQKSCRKKTIAQHVSSVHKNRPFLCDACPSSFKHFTALERHKITHQPNRPRNFSCEICERKFLSKAILSGHMKTHDESRKPAFACDQCEKTFFYKTALRLHTKIHTGDVVQCQECQKTFLRPVDLKVHMRTHTGDKPYQCDRCDKSFAVVCHLNKHILKHEGYGYKCDECGKKYGDQGSLTAHIRTHRGEEPFKCAVCDKVFGQKYQTRLHIQRNHAITNRGDIDSHIIRIAKPKTCRKRIPMHKDGKYVYPI